MRGKKITAMVMAIFMALSMLPTAVFAAAEPILLEGELKLQEIVAVGDILSANYEKVIPQGITDDDVSFLWERKTPDDEFLEAAGEIVELKELGKEKTYEVKPEDLGNKIVLTITGLEERGYSGSLTVTSKTVTEAIMEDSSAMDVAGEIPLDEYDGTEEIYYEDIPETYDYTEEELIPDETMGLEEDYSEEEYYEDWTEDSYTEEIPEATADGTWEEEIVIEIPSEESGDGAGDTAMDGIPVATSDDTVEETVDTAAQEPLVYTAEAFAGEYGVLDFGTVVSGEESYVSSQYVTILNTGTGTLNFNGISPEHFMVQDVTEPLEPENAVQLWIVPREGTAPGSYEDTITYTTVEGADASFTAKVTITETAEIPDETIDGEEELTPVDDLNEEGELIPEETIDENAGGEDPAATTGLTVDQSEITLDSADDSEKITITNSGDVNAITPTVTAGYVSVTFDGDGSYPLTLEDGESASFTVMAAADLPAGIYSDTITFADGVKVEVTVNIADVPQEDIFDAYLDMDSLDFGSVQAGYTEAPAAQTVTLIPGENNNVSAGVTVPVSDAAESNFVVSDYSGIGENNVLLAATPATFTIQPKTGLAQGTYEETFAVYMTDDTEPVLLDTVTVTFTVTEATRHELTVTPAELIFGSAEAGYGSVSAQQVTVTNTGNVTETLNTPTANSYVVEAISSLELAPGASVSLNVYPKDGLTEGAYNGNITVQSANAQTAFYVSFIVSAQSNKLVGIQQPSAITGLSNGIAKDANSMKLPSAVTIETTQGYTKAKVTWDVKNCAYKVSSTAAQTFTVNGTVTLPSGVENPNNVSLTTTIKVSVNGYSPKLASADNNKISGLTIDKNYTEQARISFTAIGAGMDNTSPKNGDTRYVPYTWTVINTNTWKSAPYKATFGLAQSGSYSLTVVFKHQEFNGSSWVDAGTKDTKTVKFRVEANDGETEVPGVTITPAVNQKNAVDTGDATTIVPFIIALVAAIVAVVAIIIYRKKR